MEKLRSITTVALVAGALVFSAGSEIAHAPMMNTVSSTTVITISGSVGIDLS